MKKILVVFFTIVSLSSFSQSNNSVNEIGRSVNREEVSNSLKLEKGYIITKKNEYKACYIVLGNQNNNWEFIDYRKFKTSKPERLTKNDISGYGYEGVDYELIPNKNDSVFMQKLTKEEPFLYYYKTKNKIEFYSKKDEKFLLLPRRKKVLKEFLLAEMKGCSYTIENIENAIYNKNRLTYIFDRNSTCDSSRIPMFKVGFTAGYFASSFKLNSAVVYKYGTNGYFNLSDIKSSLNSGILLGTYADIPLLGKGGRLSFHPGIEYGRAKYDFEKNSNINFGYTINYYTLNLLLRKKQLKRKNPLFIDFGFIYSLLDVKESYVLEYDLQHKLASSVMGLGFGAGVCLNNTIDVSIRSNYLISETMPRVWNIQILVGVEL